MTITTVPIFIVLIGIVSAGRVQKFSSIPIAAFESEIDASGKPVNGILTPMDELTVPRFCGSPVEFGSAKAVVVDLEIETKENVSATLLMPSEQARYAAVYLCSRGGAPFARNHMVAQRPTIHSSDGTGYSQVPFAIDPSTNSHPIKILVAFESASTQIKRPYLMATWTQEATKTRSARDDSVVNQVLDLSSRASPPVPKDGCDLVPSQVDVSMLPSLVGLTTLGETRVRTVSLCVGRCINPWSTATGSIEQAWELWLSGIPPVNTLNGRCKPTKFSPVHLTVKDANDREFVQTIHDLDATECSCEW